MKFKLLLYGFYRIMKFTAWKFPAFRERLKEKNMTMVIKTVDEKMARSYVFNDGKVSSTKGDSENSDFTLAWVDPKVGAAVMAKGNPKAFMKAVMDGTLKLDGEGTIVTWFMGTADLMAKMYMKKKKKSGDDGK